MTWRLADVFVCILLCVVASNPLGMGLPLMGDGNYTNLLFL